MMVEEPELEESNGVATLWQHDARPPLRLLPLDAPARDAPAGPRAPEPALIATLAHELRTPLATLRATVELLEDLPALSPEDAGQLVRRLGRSVAWMDGLVENMTTWAAVEAGRLTLHRRPLRVLDCIEAALALVQPLLERKEQRVQVACAAPEAAVAGDPLRLEQTLVNLLTNACKYSTRGDTIRLTVAIVHDQVELRVTDQGPGIPAGEQQRIFGRYVRGAGAARAECVGHGLGLHIVKALVELHGGTVGVDSAPGQGSSFWVRLPRVSADDAPPPAVSDRHWGSYRESIAG